MRKRIVTLLCLAVALIVVYSRLSNAKQSAWVEKYQTTFSTTDGLSALDAFKQFNNEVPESQRISVLLGILAHVPKDADDAQPQVAAAIYCVDYDTYLHWTDAQKKQLLQLRDSPISDIKIEIINFLEVHNQGKDRAQIAYFLGDPDDEVRTHAVIKLAKAPNSKAILLKYVEDNKTQSDRRSYKSALHYSQLSQ